MRIPGYRSPGVYPNPFSVLKKLRSKKYGTSLVLGGAPCWIGLGERVLQAAAGAPVGRHAPWSNTTKSSTTRSNGMCRQSIQNGNEVSPSCY